MGRVNIRVHQIRGAPNDSGYLLQVVLVPKGQPKTCDCSGNPLTCYKVWKIDCTDNPSDGENIEIRLQRKKFFGGVEEIAVLVLPLVWYNLNTTTRHFFPMKTIDNKYTVKVEVEVHISTNESIRPFDAPSSPLRVQLAGEEGKEPGVPYTSGQPMATHLPGSSYSPVQPAPGYAPVQPAPGYAPVQPAPGYATTQQPIPMSPYTETPQVVPQPYQAPSYDQNQYSGQVIPPQNPSNPYGYAPDQSNPYAPNPYLSNPYEST